MDNIKAATLLTWLASGGTIRGWAQEAKIDPGSVSRWLHADPARLQAYMQADRERAEILADDILDLADAPPRNPDTGMTIAEVLHRRMQLDARKWIAARLAPKRWGDRQEAAAAGSLTINIGIPQSTPGPVVAEATAVDAVDRLEPLSDLSFLTASHADAVDIATNKPASD